MQGGYERKKKWVVYTPEPTAPKRSKNSLLPHPPTGGVDYAQFPQVDGPGYQFPAGPIHLRYGQQRADHNGYGFMHIWQQHFAHIEDHDSALEVVTNHVAGIVKPGIPIHWESGEKAALFRSPEGIVIVELRISGDNQAVYSIVSCFDGKRAHGTLIGTAC